MPTNTRATGFLALGFTLAVWSPSFAAIHVALDGYTAGAQALARFAIASLVLGVVWTLRGRPRPRSNDLARLFAAGALGITGYQLLLGYGEQTIDAGTAALLTAASPLLAVILAATRLGEHVSPKGWTGVAVGLAGGALIAVGDGAGRGITSGAALVLTAAACQAAWIVTLKPLSTRYHAADVTCWTIWAGTALMLPFAPALAAQAPHAPASATIATVWLALGATLTGFVAFTVANARLPASITATSLYLLPIGGALTAWAWLGDQPATLTVGGLLTIAGGLLTVAGVVLAAVGARAAGADARRHARSPDDLSGDDASTASWSTT